MKILILSFFYYPDLSAGSFRTKALTDSLLDKSDEIENIMVITSQPNRYLNYKVEAKNDIKKNNFCIYRIKVPRIGSGKIQQIIVHLIFFLKALQIIKEKDFDVIYVTSAKLLTAFLGSLISKYTNKPLYIDFRDIFYDVMQDTGNKFINFFILPIINLLEKITVKQASKINLVSKGFREYFENKYPDKSYSFFTNGIDKEFMYFEKLKCYDLSTKGKLTVLYAGNIGVGQGLEKIVPKLAIKLEDRVNFKIIGSGALMNKMKKNIALLNCRNIQILSPKNREKIIEEYKHADILFLHLNNYAAFKKVIPSKIFEYASTGKPIWAGVSGYAKSFLDNEVINSWTFEPSDLNSALLKFNEIKDSWSDRTEFISKYDRKRIQQQLVQDIVLTVKRYKNEK